MQGLGQSVSEIQNKLFQDIGINEEEFEALCNKHPQVINQAMLKKMKGDGAPGAKVYSLEELKNIFRIQREYLERPQLISELQ